MKGALKKTSRSRFTDAEKETAFKLFCRGWPYLRLANKFKCGESTIRTMASRADWRGRLNKIRAQTQRAVNKDLVKTELNNARLAIQVRNKAIKDFLQSTRMVTSATDCVRIMEYTDRIGAGGDQSAREGAAVPPEVLTKTLEMVKSLGVDGLKAIGKWIVETFKTPEELLNGNGQG